MKLIIIIPAYNEEQTIGDVIREIPKSIENIDSIKIFVINDGSTDNTRAKALKAGADKVISNKKNLGLAKTFSIGIKKALQADADIIVNTDADNQYNQTEISKLIQPIIDKQADIVIGDRQIKNLKFMPFGNKYGNLLGSFILKKLINSNVIDASSGFRAFTRKSAINLNVNFNHTYTHETIIQAVYNNLIIKNIPITFRPRLKGESKLIRNLFSHIKNSLIVILRTVLMYKPLKILFYLGILISIPGIFVILRFVYYYILDQGSGKIQSLIIAGIFIVIGFFVIMLGVIGDLIAQNRRINEKILYNLKKINKF